MSQSARLELAFRAMTLHRLNDPAAFGYDYGYGIQLMLTVQAAVPHWQGLAGRLLCPSRATSAL